MMFPSKLGPHLRLANDVLAGSGGWWNRVEPQDSVVCCDAMLLCQLVLSWDIMGYLINLSKPTWLILAQAIHMAHFVKNLGEILKTNPSVAMPRCFSRPSRPVPYWSP